MLWKRFRHYGSSLNAVHKSSAVMWNFDVFFVVCLIELLNKQFSCRWYETPWRSCDAPFRRLRNNAWHSLCANTYYSFRIMCGNCNIWLIIWIAIAFIASTWIVIKQWSKVCCNFNPVDKWRDKDAIGNVYAMCFLYDTQCTLCNYMYKYWVYRGQHERMLLVFATSLGRSLPNTCSVWHGW